jgi:mono/diheme cytochrome c family protein
VPPGNDAAFRMRWTMAPWKALNLEAGAYQPDPARSAEWNRGAYLVNHLAHCGECHTPRNGLGGTKRNLFLAGAPDIEGGIAPNITPDEETGIGKWSESAIIEVLKSGLLPDGDTVGGAMTDVVNHGTSHLNDEDLKAIAVYLKSVKPIRNKVEKKK